MFCARCGQQIPDATVTCPVCGRETTIQLQASPSPQGTAAAPAQVEVTGAELDGPLGVGGWLSFFLVVITVLSPLAAFSQAASTLSRVSVPTGSYVLELLRVAYGLVVGIFLWMLRPYAITLLRIYFGFIGINVLLALLSLIPEIMRTGWESVFLGPRFTQIMVLTGYTLIWFAYFRKSKRVRNTYGANL